MPSILWQRLPSDIWVRATVIRLIYCLRQTIVSSREFERTPSSSFEYHTSTGSVRLPCARERSLFVVEMIGFVILFAKSRENSTVRHISTTPITMILVSALELAVVKSATFVTMTTVPSKYDEP